MAEYNGWTNYETWLVNVWVGNDEGLYQVMLDLCRDAQNEYEAGKAMREYIDEMLEVPESGLKADLLNAAISACNWEEIAEHYIEDLEDEDED